MFRPDSEDKSDRQMFTRRAALLGLGQAGLFSAIGARLYYLQVVEHNRYALLADENRISVELLSPTRGRILDRSGIVLAENSEGYRIILVPALAGDVDIILQRLQKLIPLSDADRGRIVVRSQRQPPTTPLIVAQDLPWDLLATLNLHAPSLPGVRTEPSGKRRYHGGSAMGHIVGYVGAVERRAMDDEPVLRLPWMRIGKVGVEAALETELRGTAGRLTSEVNARGRHLRTLDRRDPLAGEDVKLTIDAALQTASVERLKEFRRAAGVIMDVQSGDVLAMPSVPGYDADVVAEPHDASGWARLTNSPDDPLINRATRGLYPPGSTFKLVTGLAAVEAGVVSLTEQIDCPGSYSYYDQTYRCWNRRGHGACNFHRAIRESCDCYFYEISRRCGISAIADMARRLGLGQNYDSAFLGQKSGLVPDPDWKRGRFNRSWLGGETLLAGIGQGYVLASPLHLAVMTSRVATGRMIRPRLLAPRGSGTVAEPANPLAIAEPSLSAMRRAMAAVVNEGGGTGHRAQPEVGNYEIAGKTGTAQVGRLSAETPQTEQPWNQRDHALFVCYAPASKPRYAVSIVVEHGGGGGATAAPVARDLMHLAMNRDQSAGPVMDNALSGQPPSSGDDSVAPGNRDRG